MDGIKNFWVNLRTPFKIMLLMSVGLFSVCSLCLCVFIIIPTPESDDSTVDDSDEIGMIDTETPARDPAANTPATQPTNTEIFTSTPISASLTPINPSTDTAQPPSQTSTSTPDLTTPAIKLVSDNLPADNLLNIQAQDLQGKENPKGEGIFVYVEQTRFSGVERYIVWLVIENVAYPLNGATKDVTPDLPWPREAPGSVWARTGLDPYVATEALEIVFGP